MKCNCGYVIPYTQEREGKDARCIVCGETYRDDPDDILLHGKYGIAREVRPTQADMARDIDDLIYRDGHGTLYAEGGTGIGKSFAYLIPALLAGKRVVVSTAKKSLQHQLVEKDLPFLVSKMGKDVKFGVYKGKNNYGCIDCAGSIKDKNDRDEFRKWASKCLAKHKAADVAEWPGPRPKWWDDVTVENCPQKKREECPHCQYCRPQPKHWDIVVTNHSLLAIDLLLGLEPGFLMGTYPILVIDEAHKAPEMFRSAVTESITLWNTANLLAKFERDDQLHAELTGFGYISEKNAHKAFVSVRDVFAKMHKKIFGEKRKSESVTVKTIVPYKADIEKLRDSTDLLYDAVGRTAKQLAKDISDGARAADLKRAKAVLGRINQLVNRVKALNDRLRALADQIDKDEAHIKMGGNPKPGNWIIVADDKGIHRKPVKIGDVCGKALATMTTHRIIVSATLTIDETFDFIRNEFGVEEAVAMIPDLKDNVHMLEGVYRSAFDLNTQALLYTPAMLPVPEYPNTEFRWDWVEAISNEIERLLIASQGDAFVLFTSKTDLQEVLETIDTSNLLSHGIKILPQIDGIDAQRLTAEYMDTPSSALFGLKSFWEGVDVPGDKLRLVIIPKLPFPSPKDPIIEALSAKAKEAGKNAFMAVSVPQMTFDLKQAVGRLIRTQTDRGVVALLDTRVWSAKSDRDKHAKIMAEIRKMRGWIRDYPSKAHRFKDDATYRGYGKKAVDATGFSNRTHSFTKAEAFVKKP